MSASYDFYKNPEPGRKSLRPRLHARIVPVGTMEAEDLAREIHDRSTLTEEDVLAVILSLSQKIIYHLKEGRRIHIEGLGYFQLTLKCPPVRSSKEIRAESVSVKSIAFRPEQKVKEKLSSTKLVRAEHKRHSATHTEEELEQLLTNYFATHASISRSEFQELACYRQSMAGRILRGLVEGGKLIKTGLSRFPMYAPVEGYFGKMPSA